MRAFPFRHPSDGLKKLFRGLLLPGILVQGGSRNSAFPVGSWPPETRLHRQCFFRIWTVSYRRHWKGQRAQEKCRRIRKPGGWGRDRGSVSSRGIPPAKRYEPVNWHDAGVSPQLPQPRSGSASFRAGALGQVVSTRAGNGAFLNRRCHFRWKGRRIYRGSETLFRVRGTDCSFLEERFVHAAPPPPNVRVDW